MLTALRREVTEALAALPTSRRAALRRPEDAGSLLATNLPFLADVQTVADFTQTLTQQGWRVLEQNGWLLLDAPVPLPEKRTSQPHTGERACCIALLARHPGNAPAEDLIRAFAKAHEEGPQQVERFCTALHDDLAARLRLHQPLPGDLLPYLENAP